MAADPLRDAQAALARADAILVRMRAGLSPTNEGNQTMVDTDPAATMAADVKKAAAGASAAVTTATADTAKAGGWIVTHPKTALGIVAAVVAAVLFFAL